MAWLHGLQNLENGNYMRKVHWTQ